MKNATLKQTIIEAAEFYERHAEYLHKRAERASEGSNIQREIYNAYEYRKGQARAMREALEYIEEYLG